MKQLIIYDLDGTLVDTREDIARSANHMLAEMGLSAISKEEVARYVGRGLFQLVQSCLKTDDPKKIEKGAKIYRAYYAEHMLDHSELYSGAREILEHFKGRKQGVLTNKPNPFSEDLLKALGVGNYFEMIVAGDSEYPKKPSPAAVHAMMHRWKISAQDTLFIGDSLVDIETARNAGVEIAVVSHGFSSRKELQSASPEILVSGFQELLEKLKGLQW